MANTPCGQGRNSLRMPALQATDHAAPRPLWHPPEPSKQSQERPTRTETICTCISRPKSVFLESNAHGSRTRHTRSRWLRRLDRSARA